MKKCMVLFWGLALLVMAAGCGEMDDSPVVDSSSHDAFMSSMHELSAYAIEHELDAELADATNFTHYYMIVEEGISALEIEEATMNRWDGKSLKEIIAEGQALKKKVGGKMDPEKMAEGVWN